MKETADADFRKELRKSESALKKAIDRKHQESPKIFCQQMHDEVQVLVEAVGWEMLDEMQPHERDSDVVEHNDQSTGWYLPDLFHNI